MKNIYFIQELFSKSYANKTDSVFLETSTSGRMKITKPHIKIKEHVAVNMYILKRIHSLSKSLLSHSAFISVAIKNVQVQSD